MLSQAVGIVLGLFAALGRLSRSPFSFWRALTGFYLWLFRGTPLLVQIAFVYFAVPQITDVHVNTRFALLNWLLNNHRIVINEFWSAMIALSLNEGAYMAEIVRAGITSVEAGQMEAAQSLGMTHWTAMRRVIIPQAIRVIIPPTGNEFISMLKNTSLAYVISTHEIFFETNALATATFRYFEPLTIVSLWYLAMTTVATYVQGHLERHFGRGFSRDYRGPGPVQRALAGALRRG